MNTVTLEYVYDNEKLSLEYELFTEYTVVQKWLKLWKHYSTVDTTFDINSECPTTINSLDYYHNEVFTRCERLVKEYGVEIVDGWDKPPYTQEILNVIHDDFAENVVIIDSNDDPEFKNILVELNHQIHTLEGAMQGGGLHAYARSILKNPWRIEEDPEELQLLEESDQLNKQSGFIKRHCLFLSYASLGKELEMILNDDHIGLLERNEMVAKTTVSPWFAFCIPEQDDIEFDADEENRIRIEWMREQAERYNIEQYGVDVNHWIHRPGRHIMGINNSGSQSDRQWFIKYGEKCSLNKIIFNTDIIKTTVELKDNSYTFN